MCLNHRLSATFDTPRADAFAERLLGVLNQGALCLMISIGHRTGLFDALRELPSAGHEAIARAANLDERYVVEWLGAMVTGGLVEYDPATQSYLLPEEHAAYLSRDAGADNIAVFAQYIGVLGAVEDDVVRCFHEGGGVPYSRYPRFHEVMAEDSGQTVLSNLFEHILPLIPGITQRLEAGIDVLDLGCGRGRALQQMAARYPNSRFTGYDLSDEAIEHARQSAREQNLNNIHFETRDLSDFDQTAEPERFDLITTFDAVHDQARPRAMLKGIHTSLKPDGTYLMQDIHAHSGIEGNLDHPIAPLLYTVSTMHCTTVSLAQGGEGLGTMWGQEMARELLREAGFSNIVIHQLEHDFQNDYYVIRK